METFFPYDISNLATGPLRVVYAKRSDLTALPAKIADIVDEVDPYALTTHFKDFGAAINPGSYSTSSAQSDLTLENDVEPVDTEVTAVTRSLGFNVAELSDTALAIIENSPGVDTIAKGASASGEGSQKGVPFGSYNDLDDYCVAFIGRRRKKAGLVHEVALDDGRGRMFVVALWSAKITGDAKTAQFAKGSLSGMDVTFQAYPDADADGGKDHGNWFFEDAQTLP